MSDNSQAEFTSIVDQLWSEGKVVKNLYNLKDMVQKLSASVRRDQLLTQINQLLHAENTIILIDALVYQRLQALDYSVEHWVDLVHQLAQANSDRAKAVSNMESMKLRLDELENAEACLQKIVNKLESEKRDKRHVHRENDVLFLFYMKLVFAIASTLLILCGVF